MTKKGDSRKFCVLWCITPLEIEYMKASQKAKGKSKKLKKQEFRSQKSEFEYPPNNQRSSAVNSYFSKKYYGQYANLHFPE